MFRGALAACFWLVQYPWQLGPASARRPHHLVINLRKGVLIFLSLPSCPTVCLVCCGNTELCSRCLEREREEPQINNLPHTIRMNGGGGWERAGFNKAKWLERAFLSKAKIKEEEEGKQKGTEHNRRRCCSSYDSSLVCPCECVTCVHMCPCMHKIYTCFKMQRNGGGKQRRQHHSFLGIKITYTIMVL